MLDNELREVLKKHDQEHLLTFWNELNEEEKLSLEADLRKINFPEVVSYFKKANDSLNEDVAKLDERMKPIPDDRKGSELQTSAEELELYRQEGLRRIANGEVSVLLMAGGQGTRLGVTYPKGMYKVGLLSEKCLFQIQAERIRKLQQLAQGTGKIIWYIMTSEATDAETKKFFSANNNFGLDSNQIVYFKQGKLPCFDFNGRIFLSEKHKVSQAPDGNGGIYRALRDEKVLDDMTARGVRYVHAHSVDNILIRPADPIFIGYCLSKSADCAAKVVEKTSPDEAVGVVCLVDDKYYQVVEYSEISKATSELSCTSSDGRKRLMFDAGNICNHFFSVDFLKRVAEKHESSLKLHVAKKKIPFVDPQGNSVKPSNPNGIKVEKFVFDVFQFAEKFVTWEVPREAEFSALKNADSAGKDCPSTARKDLYALHKSFIQKAGGIVKGDEIEISPLLSYAGEGLKDIAQDHEFEAPCHLGPDNKE